VYNNETFIRPFIAQKIMKEFTNIKKQKDSLLYIVMIMTKLTTAEMEILKSIYYGQTRKEIAQQRFVELVTVNTQVGNILKKFGYKRTKDLVKALSQLKAFDLFDN
jgi:DNA-binding NarL/FixJ family response regulator